MYSVIFRLYTKKDKFRIIRSVIKYITLNSSENDTHAIQSNRKLYINKDHFSYVLDLVESPGQQGGHVFRVLEGDRGADGSPGGGLAVCRLVSWVHH